MISLMTYLSEAIQLYSKVNYKEVFNVVVVLGLSLHTFIDSVIGASIASYIEVLDYTLLGIPVLC